MSENSDDREEKIIKPDFDIRYNELPKELLEKLAYCKLAVTRRCSKSLEGAFLRERIARQGRVHHGVQAAEQGQGVRRLGSGGVAVHHRQEVREFADLRYWSDLLLRPDRGGQERVVLQVGLIRIINKLRIMPSVVSRLP